MDPGLDFHLVVLKLRRNRWWIVASAALGAAALGAVAFLMTPVYSASTVLISTTADRSSLSGVLSSSLGGLAALTGLTSGSDDPASQEALAVLQSRQFTEKFISDLHLMPVLFPDTWNKAQDPPTLAKAAKYFSEEVRDVSEDKKTGLVTLEIQWTDANRAAEWANVMVERLNAEMSARAIAQAEASIGFLERAAKEASAAETRDAVSRLMEAQEKQRMLASVNREFSFRVVDKALPPDADDMVKPNRVLLLIAGPVVGVLVAVMVVLIQASVGTRAVGRER